MWYFVGIPIVPANREWFPAAFFFVCLSFMFILMRIYSRIFLIRSMGWDDGLMVLAMGLVIGQTYTIIEQIRLGLGDEVREDYVAQFGMLVYFTALIYTWTQWVIKMSIVAQYHRLFPTTKPRRLIRWMLIWLGIYGVVNCIVPIFMCTPIKRFWDRTIPGSCFHYHAFHFFLSGVNTIHDFMILIFPIPILLKLKLPLRVRVILVITFSCGLVAITASIMRFQALVIFASGPPEQGPVLNVKITTWSSLELTLSIICGSVPSIKPLFALFIPRLDALFTTDENTPKQYKKRHSAKSWVQLEDRHHHRVTSRIFNDNIETARESGVWVERTIEVKSSIDHDRINESILEPSERSEG